MPRPRSPAAPALASHALLVVLAACAPGRSSAPVPVPAAECGARGAETIVVGVASDWPGGGAVGCGGAVLDVRIASGDQRDQVDAGADVVVTRDPATIEYARARGGFESIPLDWDRTYALVVPRRPAAWLADTSPGFRPGLARDVVTAAARAAEGPFWWEQAPITCPPPSGRFPPDFFGSLVAYHDRDRTARELTERLIALAAEGGTSLRALPRPDTAGIHSPRRESATVMSIPRAGSNAEACALGLGDATVVPLVDTRATAIVRRDRARVVPVPGGGLQVFPAPAVR